MMPRQNYSFHLIGHLPPKPSAPTPQRGTFPIPSTSPNIHNTSNTPISFQHLPPLPAAKLSLPPHRLNASIVASTPKAPPTFAHGAPSKLASRTGILSSATKSVQPSQGRGGATPVILVSSLLKPGHPRPLDDVPSSVDGLFCAQPNLSCAKSASFW